MNPKNKIIIDKFFEKLKNNKHIRIKPTQHEIDKFMNYLLYTK